MTKEHVEDFIKYAEKLTREEVKQAITYVVKSGDSAEPFSYLTEEEYEEKYLSDDAVYNDISEIEMFSRQLAVERNEGWLDDEYNLENVVLEVGVFGNYHLITIDDLIDKSLTDCVIDLISDVVVKDKRKRAIKKKGA